MAKPPNVIQKPPFGFWGRTLREIRSLVKLAFSGGIALLIAAVVVNANSRQPNTLVAHVADTASAELKPVILVCDITFPGNDVRTRVFMIDPIRRRVVSHWSEGYDETIADGHRNPEYQDPPDPSCHDFVSITPETYSWGVRCAESEHTIAAIDRVTGTYTTHNLLGVELGGTCRGSSEKKF